MRTFSTTLKTLEISKNESSRAQAFHALPEALKQAVIEGKMTRTEAKRRARRERIKERIESAPALSGKYGVVYANPPWNYGN